MTLKKFDLEAALRGEPVITRDGRKVLEVSCFKSNITHPVTSVIENENIQVATKKDGRYFNDGRISPDDLFMVPKVKTLWINVYYDKDKYICSNPFDSEQIAKNRRANYDNYKYLKTVSFEVEND